MKYFFTTSILLNIAAIVASTPTEATEESSNNSTVLDLQRRSNDFVGEHYCGLFANADSSNANALIKSLGGDKKNNKYSIGAHGCYRVACQNTSGVYVCNVSHENTQPPPPGVFLFSLLCSICFTLSVQAIFRRDILMGSDLLWIGQ